MTQDDQKTAVSPGHIGWDTESGIEYYLVGQDVYRAHWTCVFDLDTGSRIGRYETTIGAFRAARSNDSNYSYVTI